jgi:F-type H+-transporting ATPase subunit c
LKTRDTKCQGQPTPWLNQLKFGTTSSRVGVRPQNFIVPQRRTVAGARSGRRRVMFIDLLAQATPLIGDKGLALAGIGIGAGIITLGAAKGIGHLAGQAMEGIARQPEAGGRIGTNMIIAAALIEGFTFFALVIALLMNNKVQNF